MSKKQTNKSFDVSFTTTDDFGCEHFHNCIVDAPSRNGVAKVLQKDWGKKTYVQILDIDLSLIHI